MPMNADPSKAASIARLKQRLIDEGASDPLMRPTLDAYHRGEYTWEEAATELAVALMQRGPEGVGDEWDGRSGVN